MSEAAILTDNLWVRYGDTPALAGVSLRVEEGDFLGIIGPNGGGKTTLLKAILGLVTPSEGSITVHGKKPGKTENLIGYVPQLNVLDRRFPINVHEVVLMGTLSPSLTPFYRYQQKDRARVDELLERVGIAKLKHRQISALSGGELQKMLIARALAVSPRLLLLDEPTASVDATSREQIFSLLGELSDDITIVMVTHDLLAVSSHVRSLACLNTCLVYHGIPELDENVVLSVYGCPVDLISHGVVPHRVLGQHQERE